jgi:hypothetical protein
MSRASRWGFRIITVIAAFTVIGPVLADFNSSHFFNPAWTPHAKFHSAQTMMFGVVSGLLALYFLWFRSGSTLENLKLSAMFSSLYWVAMLPCILFPGTAFFDPQFANEAPRLGGFAFNQAMMAGILLLLLGVAFLLERRVSILCDNPPRN